MVIKMFKVSKVPFLVFIVFHSSVTFSKDGDFNLKALELNDGNKVSAQDLNTLVNSSDEVLPGIYLVDIYFNNHYMSTSKLKFSHVKVNGDDELRPGISKHDLKSYGVIFKDLSSADKLNDKEKITNWDSYIPNFLYKFDAKKQIINLYVPQIYVEKNIQGAVDPSHWDEGINALMLDYNLQGLNNWRDDGKDTSSYYANLRSGFNLGRWRVRNYSTYSYSSSEHSNNLDNLGTKLFTDVRRINSRFEVGNINTQSDIFDGVSLKGAQLFSDDAMRPESQQGFAPVIHGIANSNAKVTVEQDGSIIYQTVVAPGQFIIDDLYPTSTSGDLLVTITEEDGSEKTFIQPFSSTPNMVRENQFKYSLSAGQFDSDSIDSDSFVTQGTAMYGLSNELTIYGGFQAAEKYGSFALGLGFSLGDFGAISTDMSYSIADLDSEGYTQGQSYSIDYSKNFEQIGASVTLASYRYSTKNYYTLEDLLAANTDGDEVGYEDHKKERLQLSYNQQLNNSEWGSLSLYGYTQKYWDSDYKDRNLSASYSNNISIVNYTLSYSWMDSDRYSDDKQLMLTLTLPLDSFEHTGYIDYTLTEDSDHMTTNRVSYTNTALVDNNLSYTLSGMTQDHSNNDSASASVSYTGSRVNLDSSISQSRGATQLSYGASGAIIAHSGGVTLSQPINSTEYNGVVLVDTDNAEGVHINNGTGIKTDSNGYAVVPYVNSFRDNEVSIDSDSLKDNMEAVNTVKKVAPTSGAVVKTQFNVKSGYKALIQLNHNGNVVPFGARVKVKGDITHEVSYVGDNGEVYLTGLSDSDEINVNWGDSSCKLIFNINDKTLVKYRIVKESIVCK